MSKMHHFLLTRFNTRAPWFQTYPGITPTWLEHRFRLFERFCVPSVAAQQASYDWLVFCDNRTPPAFRTRLSCLASRGLFFPVYVEGILRDSDIALEVHRRMRADTEILVSTRLDNDDGICKDYVKRVQQAVRDDRSDFVNFPLGLQWHRGRFYVWLEPSNPFVSRIEIRPRLTADWRPGTVFCDVGHRDLADVAPLRQIWSPPAWLQVIHDRNLANVRRGIRWPLRRPPPGVAMER